MSDLGSMAIFQGDEGMMLYSRACGGVEAFGWVERVEVVLLVRERA